MLRRLASGRLGSSKQRHSDSAASELAPVSDVRQYRPVGGVQLGGESDDDKKDVVIAALRQRIEDLEGALAKSRAEVHDLREPSAEKADDSTSSATGHGSSKERPAAEPREPSAEKADDSTSSAAGHGTSKERPAAGPAPDTLSVPDDPGAVPDRDSLRYSYRARSRSSVSGVVENRYASDAKLASYAKVETYFAGLEGLIGTPSSDFMTAMAAEHRSNSQFDAWNAGQTRHTTPYEEWQYVTQKRVDEQTEVKWQGRDQLPDRGRGGWCLANFAAQAEVKACGLLLPEVAAVRLYTGPMYVLYQQTLREASSHTEGLRVSGSRTFVTTLHAINSAVLKCSRHTKATTVYRGLTGLVMPETFHVDNDHGVKGGVECAFMSTSTDRQVALRYMEQDGCSKARILLELRMGMVDRGADVSLLSQFPGEAEILFAPLTGLEVLDSKPDTTNEGMQIYQVRLSCNLRDQTLEEVVSKMQRSHLALIESTLERLRFDAPKVALAPLQKARDKAQERGGEFFNVENFYQQATEEALSARKECFDNMMKEEMWRLEENDHSQGEIARRMRSVAEFFAHDEQHHHAAVLLSWAVARAGFSCEQTQEKLKDAKKHLSRDVQPKAREALEAALEAAAELLASGQARLAPWPLTLRELGAMAGDKKGHGAMAILAMSLGQPLSIVRERLFDSDATPEARKGTSLLCAAAEGDASRVEAELRKLKSLSHMPPEPGPNQVSSPIGLHEHSMSDMGETLKGHDCDLRGPCCSHLVIGAKMKPPRYRCTHKHNGEDTCDFDVCQGCFDAGTEGKYAADEAYANQVTPLMLASRVAALGAVRVLLAEGGLPNRRSKRMCTPLSLAAEHPQGQEVVDALLEAGALAHSKDMNQRTPLIEAAQSGSLESVRHLIRALKTTPNALNDGGDLDEEGELMKTTALMRATQGGRVAIVRLLLQNGAEVNLKNVQERSALFFACQGCPHPDRTEAASVLLEAKAMIQDCGDSPLFTACDYGASDIVALLLNRGADVNVDETGQRQRHSPCLEKALQRGHDEIVCLLQKAGTNGPPTTPGVTNKAREPGASGSALRLAAMEGDKEQVQEVLNRMSEGGAFINDRDQSGQSAIWHASYHAHEQVVRVLIEEGVDVNAANFHNATPLIAACYPERVPEHLKKRRGVGWVSKTPGAAAKCVKLLLDTRKANLNAVDGDGDSALHNAAHAGFEECAKLLLDQKADPTLRNRMGETAADVALALHPGKFKFLVGAEPKGSDAAATSRQPRASAPPAKTSGTVVETEDVDHFQHLLNEAFAAGRALVVDFTADWCPPSQRIAPLFRELASEHKDMDFVKVDVDRNKLVAQHYGVRAMPTFKMFLERREVDRYVDGGELCAWSGSARA